MHAKDTKSLENAVVEIKPTYKCNQKCIFCLWEHRKKLPEMELYSVRCAIAHMRDLLKPQSLILSGGEPTILPYFGEILETIRQDLFPDIFHLHTNATNLTNHIRRLSVGVGKLHSATVGLHGHSAEIQESITRRNRSFEKAVDGIRMLLDIGYEIGVVCVLCKQNYKFISNITEFLLVLGVHKIEIRLPFAGPKADLTGITPDRKSMEPLLREWFKDYAREKKVHIAASEAFCFDRRRIWPKNCPTTCYSFFDVNTILEKPRKSRRQLGAIWRNAFSAYRKCDSCRLCVMDNHCKGYSTLESDAGFAQYNPITAEDVLSSLWHVKNEKESYTLIGGGPIQSINFTDGPVTFN